MQITSLRSSEQWSKGLVGKSILDWRMKVVDPKCMLLFWCWRRINYTSSTEYYNQHSTVIVKHRRWKTFWSHPRRWLYPTTNMHQDEKTHMRRLPICRPRRALRSSTKRHMQLFCRYQLGSIKRGFRLFYFRYMEPTRPRDTVANKPLLRYGNHR